MKTTKSKPLIVHDSNALLLHKVIRFRYLKSHEAGGDKPSIIIVGTVQIGGIELEAELVLPMRDARIAFRAMEAAECQVL